MKKSKRVSFEEENAWNKEKCAKIDNKWLTKKEYKKWVKTKRIRINSKDLKLWLKIKVISNWPVLKEEDVETDISIYKYKDLYLQPTFYGQTIFPDYIDEQYNYYKVVNVSKDKVFDCINYDIFTEEEWKDGKRN